MEGFCSAVGGGAEEKMPVPGRVSPLLITGHVAIILLLIIPIAVILVRTTPEKLYDDYAGIIHCKSEPNAVDDRCLIVWHLRSGRLHHHQGGRQPYLLSNPASHPSRPHLSWDQRTSQLAQKALFLALIW
mmetsp:Transcript_33536/g.56865  ORF Transcript_33536/g.56865 Transcript_33536/m.56865 type:complete len:130 (-) Transcript_33536:1534-1923(-)